MEYVVQQSSINLRETLREGIDNGVAFSPLNNLKTDLNKASAGTWRCSATWREGMRRSQEGGEWRGLRGRSVKNAEAIRFGDEAIGEVAGIR